MHYTTYLPSGDLAGFIKCCWTLEAEQQEQPQQQVIVPDGCMEMIFHYGDLYRQYTAAGDSFLQPRCFVFGQLTAPLTIEPSGKTGIFAVRFQPDGFMPFCTQPVQALEDKAVALDALFGKEGSLLAGSVLAAGTAAARIGLVEQFLRQHIADPATIDRIVRATASTILELDGSMPVGALARNLDISRRSLERRFAAAVGLSPKQLSRIIRLQAALQLLLRGQGSNLTHLAYDRDYYDQAHFIRDFKAFTGYTPKQFYNGRLELSRLFQGQQ
ncbi:helix-turn-helix domain-containing protein [Taibaiella koreensis]|uniref:helix-turn-helix domain-containing protein n=1 Tax=Taibaiella koreensis TaxID=1268548 RepID=UPI000E59CCCB|nr:helix-turn-helix domain-containing protein [Taibaiella koreensis]